MKTSFRNQVDLLLDVIGYSTIPGKLALKGGTAINLFVNDLTRLSVDIDLAYLPLHGRPDAINELKSIAQSMAKAIETKLPLVKCKVIYAKDGFPTKILVTRQNVEIKIEINNIFRGSIYPAQKMKLCQKAQDLFGKYVAVESLSFEDLYAGKFCAALDRQHPRDLYDVMVFFKSHQITAKLKDAFLIYMLSSGRPAIELLNPNLLDVQSSFEKDLVGMTDHALSYDDLCTARVKLVKYISASLSEQDKQFLVSFESGDPGTFKLLVQHSHYDKYSKPHLESSNLSIFLANY